MRASIVVSALSLLVLFQGCAFSKLETELIGAANLFVITGTVTSVTADAGALVVSAYTASGQAVPIGYDVIQKPGRFALILPAGRYKLAAFQDMNANKRWDRGEPAGYYGEIEPSGLKLQLHENVDITVDADGSLPQDFPSDPFGVARQPVQLGDFGTSVTLDTPTFAPRYGQMGLWEPYTFLYEAAPGLYLLEPYDPNRVPVLFIHGTGGTPQDWRYFINHLDRTRYQAWVYHYASGLPLELSALYLNRMADELHRMHAFECVIVVGHSVGGLVGKRFIDMNRAATGLTYVGLFISIATPWGGVESAEIGVNYAPTVIPSWVDISPESEFLVVLYSQASPLSVPHILFFAYGRDRVFRLANTDGRVTLDSQLEPRIKNSAFAIDGFNADHVGILHSAAAFERSTEFMDATPRRKSSRAKSTNQSNVHDSKRLSVKD